MTYRLEVEYDAPAALQALVLKEAVEDLLGPRLTGSRLLLEVGSQSLPEALAKARARAMPSQAARDLIAGTLPADGSIQTGQDQTIQLAVDDIDRANELLELAWGIIANSGGGDWSNESTEWREAAERWRDHYHERIRG